MSAPLVAAPPQAEFDHQDKFFIPAPPPAEYPSAEDAEAAIHEWTKANKYNASRKKVARNDEGEVRYVLFACDRSGKPKNTRNIKDSDRQRPMVSPKRSGCEMRISIVAVDAANTAGPWKIAHTKDGSEHHNHRASSDVRVHFAHRQRDARRAKSSDSSGSDLVSLQVKAGVSTSKIYATMIMSDKDSLVLPRDIDNMKEASRIELLATQTSTEALFSLLKKHKVHYSFEVDELSHQLRYLMWAHSATTDLARRFVDVLALDCTYKTNKYRMPVLNAIILTGMNTILPVAQIWMPGEAEPDFLWALQKLKVLLEAQSISLPRLVVTDRDLACTNATEKVFPSSKKLLCRWHIRRNVLAQAQKQIVVVGVPGATPLLLKNMKELQVDTFMTQFDDTINAHTEREFNEGCSVLQNLSVEMDNYLCRYWWPYKTKFVRCWTDKFCHFGCLDTSTVEGTHEKMKSFLDNSQGDIVTVFQRLLPWWIRAATNNSVQAAKEESTIPQLIRHDMYSAVVKTISVHALTENHKQWKVARKIVVRRTERSVCDGVLRRTHGRSCLHDMIRIVDSNGALKLSPYQFDSTGD